jgi:hypothetical protein
VARNPTCPGNVDIHHIGLADSWQARTDENASPDDCGTAGARQHASASDHAAWHSAESHGTHPGSENGHIDVAKACLDQPDGGTEHGAGGHAQGEDGIASFALDQQSDSSGLAFNAPGTTDQTEQTPADTSTVGEDSPPPTTVTQQGTPAKDDLQSNATDALVNGTAASDSIVTGAGNDHIVGGPGDDSIDGGVGLDTAFYSGSRDQYQVSNDADGSLTVQDMVAGRDGTDTLTHVESLHFANPEIYRFYNTVTDDHFYTSSVAERDQVLATQPSYSYEGVAFFGAESAAASVVPVYRFLDSGSGDHFYTVSVAERDSVLATEPNYHLEGVAFYAAATAQDGYTPLYRFYNTVTHDHFYTVSTAERDNVLAHLPDYHLEGVGYYVPTSSSADAIFNL